MRWCSRSWECSPPADVNVVHIRRQGGHRLTTRRPRAAEHGYHHGNLRQALLDHAVELAREGGPDAVVLRDVQRLAGVSNSAAYRHYADREALLAAVAGVALDRLADTMLTRLEAVPNRGRKDLRALARIRATGRAYVEFAVTEPGLFRTAFAHNASEVVTPPETDAAPTDEPHPFRILVGCVDDLVAAAVLAADRRDGVDEAAWASVHGLATLFLDGPLREVGDERRTVLTDRLLDVVADGLR